MTTKSESESLIISPMEDKSEGDENFLKNAMDHQSGGWVDRMEKAKNGFLMEQGCVLIGNRREQESEP